MARFEGAVPLDQFGELYSYDAPGDYVAEDQNSSIVGDTWTDLKAGAGSVVESAAGLADVARANLTGEDNPDWTFTKGLYGSGYGDWKESLQQEYSPARQESDAAVRQAIEDADTEGGKAAAAVGAYITHPRSLFGLGVQSVPGMVAAGGAGGMAAKGAMALRAAPKYIPMAAKVGAATGEGMQSAGQAASQIIQSNDEEGKGSYENVNYAVPVGAGVAATAGVAGKFGGDLEAGIFNRSARRQAAKGSLLRHTAAEAAEEAAQAPWETIPQNLATDNEWSEGLGQNVAESALAGGAMGGGMHLATHTPKFTTHGQTDLLGSKKRRKTGAAQPQEQPQGQSQPPEVNPANVDDYLKGQGFVEVPQTPPATAPAPSAQAPAPQAVPAQPAPAPAQPAPAPAQPVPVQPAPAAEQSAPAPQFDQNAYKELMRPVTGALGKFKPEAFKSLKALVDANPLALDVAKALVQARGIVGNRADQKRLVEITENIVGSAKSMDDVISYLDSEVKRLREGYADEKTLPDIDLLDQTLSILRGQGEAGVPNSAPVPAGAPASTAPQNAPEAIPTAPTAGQQPQSAAGISPNPAPNAESAPAPTAPQNAPEAIPSGEASTSPKISLEEVQAQARDWEAWYEKTKGHKPSERVRADWYHSKAKGNKDFPYTLNEVFGRESPKKAAAPVKTAIPAPAKTAKPAPSAPRGTRGKRVSHPDDGVAEYVDVEDRDRDGKLVFRRLKLNHADAAAARELQEMMKRNGGKKFTVKEIMSVARKHGANPNHESWGSYFLDMSTVQPAPESKPTAPETTTAVPESASNTEPTDKTAEPAPSANETPAPETAEPAPAPAGEAIPTVPVTRVGGKTLEKEELTKPTEPKKHVKGTLTVKPKAIPEKPAAPKARPLDEALGPALAEAKEKAKKESTPAPEGQKPGESDADFLDRRIADAEKYADLVHQNNNREPTEKEWNAYFKDAQFRFGLKKPDTYRTLILGLPEEAETDKAKPVETRAESKPASKARASLKERRAAADAWEAQFEAHEGRSPTTGERMQYLIDAQEEFGLSNPDSYAVIFEGQDPKQLDDTTKRTIARVKARKEAAQERKNRAYNRRSSKVDIEITGTNDDGTPYAFTVKVTPASARAYNLAVKIGKGKKIAPLVADRIAKHYGTTVAAWKEYVVDPKLQARHWKTSQAERQRLEDAGAFEQLKQLDEIFAKENQSAEDTVADTVAKAVTAKTAMPDAIQAITDALDNYPDEQQRGLLTALIKRVPSMDAKRTNRPMVLAAAAIGAKYLNATDLQRGAVIDAVVDAANALSENERSKFGPYMAFDPSIAKDLEQTIKDRAEKKEDDEVGGTSQHGEDVKGLMTPTGMPSEVNDEGDDGTPISSDEGQSYGNEATDRAPSDEGLTIIDGSSGGINKDGTGGTSGKRAAKRLREAALKKVFGDDVPVTKDQIRLVLAHNGVKDKIVAALREELKNTDFSKMGSDDLGEFTIDFFEFAELIESREQLDEDFFNAVKGKCDRIKDQDRRNRGVDTEKGKPAKKPIKQPRSATEDSVFGNKSSEAKADAEAKAKADAEAKAKADAEAKAKADAEAKAKEPAPIVVIAGKRLSDAAARFAKKHNVELIGKPADTKNDAIPALTPAQLNEATEEDLDGLVDTPEVFLKRYRFTYAAFKAAGIDIAKAPFVRIAESETTFYGAKEDADQTSYSNGKAIYPIFSNIHLKTFSAVSGEESSTDFDPILVHVWYQAHNEEKMTGYVRFYESNMLAHEIWHAFANHTKDGKRGYYANELNKVLWDGGAEELVKLIAFGMEVEKQDKNSMLSHFMYYPTASAEAYLMPKGRHANLCHEAFADLMAAYLCSAEARNAIKDLAPSLAKFAEGVINDLATGEFKAPSSGLDADPALQSGDGNFNAQQRAVQENYGPNGGVQGEPASYPYRGLHIRPDTLNAARERLQNCTFFFDNKVSDAGNSVGRDICVGPLHGIGNRNQSSSARSSSNTAIGGSNEKQASNAVQQGSGLSRNSGLLNPSEGGVQPRYLEGIGSVQKLSVQALHRTMQNRAIAAMPANLRGSARSLADWASTTFADRKMRWGLGFMFTEDFVNYGKKILPEVAKVWNAMRRTTAFRNMWQTEVSDIVKQANSWNAAKREQVNNFIAEATLTRVWPYYEPEAFPPTTDKNGKVTMTSEERWKAYKDRLVDNDDYARVSSMWEALPEDAKSLVRDVFHHGAKASQTREQISADNIRNAYADEIALARTPAQKAALELERDMEIKRVKDIIPKSVGPYAPLRRFGEFVVAVRSKDFVEKEQFADAVRKRIYERTNNNPTKEQLAPYFSLVEQLAEMQENSNNYIVETFDSAYAAKKRAEALQREMADSKVQYFQREKYLNSEVPAWQKLEQVVLSAELAEDNPNNLKDQAMYRSLRLAARKLYVQSLIDNHARKTELRRKRVRGFHADMLENFQEQGRSEAMFLANLKHGTEMRQALSDMRAAAKKHSDRLKASYVANEMRARVERTLSGGSDPNGIAGKLMRATSSFLLLTNPAFYIQNATQPFMMSAPYMAGQHGNKAFSLLSSNMLKLTKAVIPHLKRMEDMKLEDLRILMPKDEYDGLVKLRDAGLADIGISQDFGDVSEAGQGRFAKAAKKWTDRLLTITRAQETMNRIGTYMTAYELAKADGLDKDAAYNYAYDVVYRTHGDYSGQNAPRFFTANAFTKVATQFRKFQLIQLGMMVGLANKAFRGATPAERAAGRKALEWTIGTHLVAAGAVGTPFAGLVMGAIGMAFGGDGEDDEETIRRLIGNKTVSDLLLRGLPTAFGLDLSGKIGASNMLSPFPFYEFKPQEGRDNFAELVVNLAGPWASLGSRAYDSYRYAAVGDYWKAMEQIAPVGVLSNVLKAARFGTEGVTTRSGDVTIPDENMTFVDLTAQLLGFQTMKQSDRNRLQSAVIRHEDTFDAKADRIRQDYRKAVKAGDRKAMVEARKAWREMNADRREQGFRPLKESQLIRAATDQAKRERRVIGGVVSDNANKEYLKRASER